jgi:hypothetical protein
MREEGCDQNERRHDEWHSLEITFNAPDDDIVTLTGGSSSPVRDEGNQATRCWEAIDELGVAGKGRSGDLKQPEEECAT